DDGIRDLHVTGVQTCALPIYMITLQFDSRDLIGAETILGTPVSNIEILVNGVLFRQSFAPFLSFHNGQNSTISGLISLTAGDLKIGRASCRVRLWDSRGAG